MFKRNNRRTTEVLQRYMYIPSNIVYKTGYFLYRKTQHTVVVATPCPICLNEPICVGRRRETYRKKAAQLLREGRRAEARECLQRCVDITPTMALELMNVSRARFGHPPGGWPAAL